MQENFKKILFVLLMALMSLPLFQEITRYFKEKELEGAYTKPVRPEVSLKTIASLEFQKGTEEYENSNFGFRSFLVRLKNSINYLLFKDVIVGDQIEGRDGYIFSEGSVERNILGKGNNGKEKNDSTTTQLNFIKEAIEKRGGHFLIVIAPSKENVIPEKLPAKYEGAVNEHNDYDDIIEGLKKYNIPFIDFCAYFKKIHPSYPYPLFTKTGFHWSMYGAFVAQDSLLSYVQNLVSVPIPKYHFTGVEWTDTARVTDADFEPQMNLFFSLQDHRYAYPKLEMVQASLNNYRPKVIVIGDSFFWTIKHLKNLRYIFSEDSKYLFYFKRFVPLSDGPGCEIKDIDVMSELESADLVVLFTSLGTLGDFPYGFPDYYTNHAKQRSIIECIRENLKNTLGSLAAAVKDTQVNNAEVESSLAAEARRIYRGRKKIHLKAFNNKYVCADESNNYLLIADRDNAWLWETFWLINFKEGKSSLYSFADKFLSPETEHEKEITATRTSIGKWETFDVIELDSNYVAFKAFNGKYISLDEKNFHLVARSDVIGAREKFKLISEESK